MLEFSAPRLLFVIRCAIAVLLCGLQTPCRADYCNRGTELSWEWLADASRLIVAGQVTAVHEPGCDVKVERVLKNLGVTISPGQIIALPVFGRTQLPATQHALLTEVGWPVLLAPETYPDRREPRDFYLRPKFERQKKWKRGDRCLFFFARDLHSPIQIINLDRPVTLEVEFLAVDMAGHTVTRADELLERIATRVAEGMDGLGQPRVRSFAISYGPRESCLDACDFYSVLAPPDLKIAESWDAAILDPPEEPENLPADSFVSRRERELVPPAVAYWFLSGRSSVEFAADATKQRQLVVREMLGAREAPGRDVATPHADLACGRHDILNFRTAPHGWQCTMSRDGNHVAYLDQSVLEVYAVDVAAECTDRLVLTRRDVHRLRTNVEFSPDGQLLAYTTSDNNVCLVDLREGRPQWSAKFPMPKGSDRFKPTAARTASLTFSSDQRYLVQCSHGLEKDESDWPLQIKCGESLHVWNVARGEIVFCPVEEWTSRVGFKGFDTRDTSLVLLTDHNTGSAIGGVWSLTTGTRISRTFKDR